MSIRPGKAWKAPWRRCSRMRNNMLPGRYVGRTGALEVQALATAMAKAWRVLTGRLPAKGNVKFHDLLNAVITTIFGDGAKKPNLEASTRIAVERLKKGSPGGS